MRRVSQGLWKIPASAILLVTMLHSAGANELGIRAGTTLGDDGYSSQEVYWLLQLPILQFGKHGDWNTTSQAELNAGRVRADGESMTTVGGALNLWLHPPTAPVSVGIGTGPTYHSESRLGERDLGGHWQFTSHASIRLRLSPNLGIGYRVQHTSNADLYSRNDGYDMHILEIQLGF